MTVTISFSPEEEARLRQTAAESGKNVSDFVHEAIKAKLAVSAPAPRTEEERKDWWRRFQEWAQSHHAQPNTMDDSRESIYDERGL